MGARTPSLTGSASKAGRRPLGHKSPFTPSHLPLLSGLTNLRPRGGMVDTGDLKSLGRIGRAGSSPAEGTKEILFDFSGLRDRHVKARNQSFRCGL